MAGLTPNDPVEVAAVVAAAFEELGVRYVLGGSLASTTFGEPRATQDVDFAADLQPDQVARFLALLGDDYRTEADWVVAETMRRGSFQLLHLPTVIRIDVFVPPWTGLHEWKWRHRQRLRLGEGTRGIDVTSAEGIVLQKLLWYQSGGEVSERQWRDVIGVLKAQRGSLDKLQMLHWAAKVDVGDLLQRALDEAGVQ